MDGTGGEYEGKKNSASCISWNHGYGNDGVQCIFKRL